MEMYDVYLERLTEIDVMITQLLHIESSFVLNDLLTLYATMDDYILQFCLRPQVSMELNLLPTDTFKIIHESTLFASLLDVDTSLTQCVFTGGETDMEIAVDEIDITRKYPVSGDSVLDISVDPLEYYFTLLCGNIEVDLELFADTLDTLKYSSVAIDNLNELLFDGSLSYQLIATPENIDLWLDVLPTDLYYRQDLETEFIMFLNAIIGEVVVKSLIDSADIDLWIDAVADDFGLIKALQLDCDMLLSTFSVNTVKKSFDIFDINVLISCEASAGIKRYRLLSEVDDFILADLDNMSLEELDYVIITD